MGGGQRIEGNEREFLLPLLLRRSLMGTQWENNLQEILSLFHAVKWARKFMALIREHMTPVEVIEKVDNTRG